jgi:hypothetical protein
MKDIREMSAWETFKDLPNRLVTLVWKLVSFKTAYMVVTAWILKEGGLNSWESVTLWFLVGLLVVVPRELDKWKKTFIELKTGTLLPGKEDGNE